MKKAKKKTKPQKGEVLTPLEQRLCDIVIWMELRGEVNQQKAYELAGYKCRGKTAKTEASRTLSKPPLKKYLAHARARNRRAAEKTQEKTRADIIVEYEIMAFARPADYYHADGSPKKIKELTKAQRAALRSITVVEHTYKNKKGNEGKTVRTEYAIQPKKPAMDSLAKIQGWMKGEIEEAAKSLALAMHEAMKEKEETK